MATAPTSTINLYNVPWGSDYKHVTDQAAAALSGLLVTSLSNYTYLKKDNIIRADVSMSTIDTTNYCSYTNAAHEGITFYAFINRLEYINDAVTAIHITTDVWQTWRGIMTLKSCFVEREHTATDNIGDHTVPEGLEHGDYIFHGVTSYSRALMSTLGIVAAVTEYWDSAAWQPASGNEYSGVFSGVRVLRQHVCGQYGCLAGSVRHRRQTGCGGRCVYDPASYVRGNLEQCGNGHDRRVQQP